jgi:AraC family transcriptional regulator of adaptative response/methylated-DNA-[protein]-cysteine methyltransferase
MQSWPSIPPAPVMERAFLARDASFDGLFVTGVRSTGIFCRPSCPARKPLPRNLEFFGSVREALFAGYRPCLRCRPLRAGGSHPEEIERVLDEVERNPEARLKDADLRAMGVSPARARRYFHRHFGMTFQAYSRGRRLGRAFQQIRKGTSLEDVTLGHGFESHSGFREAFRRAFGTPPGRARSGDCILAEWLETPLGPMVAAATQRAVCLLEFSDRRMLEAQLLRLRSRFGVPILPGSSERIDQLREELTRYFEGTLERFAVPLEAPGTPFQEKVWAALRRIPYAATRSYEDIARAIGSPGACRAVGTANGMNRVAIVIPCHRVVNSGGKLGGYGGGLWRKQWLLRLEQDARARRGEPARSGSGQRHAREERLESGV